MTSALTPALERAEIEALVDLYRAADSEVTHAAGLSVRQTAGATLIAVNRFDVLALNRLVGLGLHSTPSDADLADMLAAFETAGAPRYFVQLAPGDESARLGSRLEQLGLRHYNNWVRLYRGLDDLPGPPDVAGPLEVRRIDSTDAHAFGTLVATAFQYPPAIAPLTQLAVGRPRWYHYLAFDGDIPVGSAAMFVAGDAAWFGFAATDAAHRKRGAQQALIRRRLEDAVRAGCHWISVETAEDTVARDAPSYRNLRRLGFAVAYLRPNYLWTRGAPPPAASPMST